MYAEMEYPIRHGKKRIYSDTFSIEVLEDDDHDEKKKQQQKQHAQQKKKRHRVDEPPSPRTVTTPETSCSSVAAAEDGAGACSPSSSAIVVHKSGNNNISNSSSSSSSSRSENRKLIKKSVLDFKDAWIVRKQQEIDRDYSKSHDERWREHVKHGYELLIKACLKKVRKKLQLARDDSYASGVGYEMGLSKSSSSDSSSKVYEVRAYLEMLVDGASKLYQEKQSVGRNKRDSVIQDVVERADRDVRVDELNQRARSMYISDTCQTGVDQVRSNSNFQRWTDTQKTVFVNGVHRIQESIIEQFGSTDYKADRGLQCEILSQLHTRLVELSEEVKRCVRHLAGYSRRELDAMNNLRAHDMNSYAYEERLRQEQRQQQQQEELQRKQQQQQQQQQQCIWINGQRIDLNNVFVVSLQFPQDL